MNINPSELATLLEIESITSAVRRGGQELSEILSGSAIRAKEEERIAVAGELSRQIQILDDLETELNRAEGDLAVVEARIARDSAALNATSSAKEATGLQHELETLAKRKSDLEDSELELLDRISEQKHEVQRLSDEREKVAGELQTATVQASEAAAQKRSEIEAAEAKLVLLRGQVSTDLLDVYVAKATRGIAVGRLVKMTCSACNMGITSTALRELVSAPVDQLVTCPECGAILVREA